MTVHVPDHFKAANAFWIGLSKIGLTPAAVLSQARVPLTVYDGKKNLVTTAQFFALWRAVGELLLTPLQKSSSFADFDDVGSAGFSARSTLMHRPPERVSAVRGSDSRRTF